MASLMENLIEILDLESREYENLLELSTKKTPVFTDIANVINKDVNSLMLADLVDMLKARPQEQQKLAKVHDKLSNAVHEVKRVNEQNRILIQNALEMVEFDMNMLQAMKTAPETANYNKGACNTGAAMGVDGRGFDAKQ